MSLIVWSIVIFLIAVNALYVAAEFAAVSVRRSRIQQLAEDGNHLAGRLLPYVNDPIKLDRYVAACQFGITISSLVLGAYAQATLARDFAPWFAQWGNMQRVSAESTAAVVVLILLTVLQVVIGELVPKSLALTFPSQVAMYTIYPMKWSLSLFSGFIAVLNGSGGLILKWMGIPHTVQRHVHTPEEITMLLDESRQGGLLDPVEHRRLQKALSLGTRPISALMVPLSEVEAIQLNASVDQILRKVAASPYTRLPVCEGNPQDLCGFVHTKDLIMGCIESGDVPINIKSLVRPLPKVSNQTTAEGLLQKSRERHFHMAAVTDGGGQIVGLITLEDVLAELMGDVGDEFKEAYPEPEFLADGKVRVPAILTLSEVQDWVGAAWPAGDQTVATHVADALGRPAIEGETVLIDQVSVTVERLDQGAITSVVLAPQTPRAEEEESTWIF